MMLRKLLSKKKLLILGINSGTSADGVDLAAIEFSVRAGKIKVEFREGATITYSTLMKRNLEQILSDPDLSIERLARLDISYGQFLGRAASNFAKRHRVKIDLIASHGQTIAHFPQPMKVLDKKTSATVQIGDGNAIASVCGLPVVSDFRQADVSLGGEGAPITPFVNQVLFGDPKKSRIIVNIGGIANYGYHPAGGKVGQIQGGDCGPGNRLSDLACQLIFHCRYDKNGGLASQGVVISEIVDKVKKTDRRSSVSTGREQYDEILLARLVYLMRKKRGRYEDLLASVNAATAQLIYRSVRKFLKDKKLEGLYLTGGGRKNISIVRQLSDCLKPVSVFPIEALGFDGDLLEAVSFAALGGCFVSGIPSTVMNVSGARRPGVAGKLSLPAK